MLRKQNLNGNGSRRSIGFEVLSPKSRRNRIQAQEWKATQATAKESVKGTRQLQVKYDERCSQKNLVVKLAEALEKTEKKLSFSVSESLKLVSAELHRGTSLTALSREQGEFSQLPFEREVLRFCRVCRQSLTTLILSIGHDLNELGRALGGDPKHTDLAVPSIRIAELDSVSIEQKLMDNESQIGWLEIYIATALSSSVRTPPTQHLILANETSRKIRLRLLSLKHRLIFHFCDSVDVMNSISFARLKALYETNEKALGRLQEAMSVLRKIQDKSGLIITRKQSAGRPDPFTFKVVKPTFAESSRNSAETDTTIEANESTTLFTERSKFLEEGSRASSESLGSFIQVLSSQALTPQEDIHFSDLTHSDAGIESEGVEDHETSTERYVKEVEVAKVVKEGEVESESASESASESSDESEGIQAESVSKRTMFVEETPRAELVRADVESPGQSDSELELNGHQSSEPPDQELESTGNVYPVIYDGAPNESLGDQMSIESQQGRLNVDLGESDTLNLGPEESQKAPMAERLNVDLGERDAVNPGVEESPRPPAADRGPKATVKPARESPKTSMVGRLYTGISHVFSKSALSAKSVMSNAESFVAAGTADPGLDSSNSDGVVVPPPVVPLLFNSSSPQKIAPESAPVDEPQPKRYRLSMSEEPAIIPRAPSEGAVVIPPSVEPPPRRPIVVSNHPERRAGPSRTHKTAQTPRLVKRKSTPDPHLVPPEGEEPDEALRKVMRRLYDIVQR